MQLISPSIYPPNHENIDTKTRPQHRATTSPTLCEQWVGSLTSHRVIYEQGLWDGTYGLSSLSEKTRKSNHLQMSLQKQHFLLGWPGRSLNPRPPARQSGTLPTEQTGRFEKVVVLATL